MDDGAVVVQCETGRDSDFGVDVDVDVDFDVDSDVRCPMAISDETERILISLDPIVERDMIHERNDNDESELRVASRSTSLEPPTPPKARKYNPPPPNTPTKPNGSREEEEKSLCDSPNPVPTLHSIL